LNSHALIRTELSKPPGPGDALWEYERKFGVRQVALSARGDPGPENYCLRPGTEQTVDAKPIHAVTTPAGAAIFDYLKADAQLPIANSYVYRTLLQPGCATEPILKIGGYVGGGCPTTRSSTPPRSPAVGSATRASDTR
jgi:hypothetical protein